MSGTFTSQSRLAALVAGLALSMGASYGSAEPAMAATPSFNDLVPDYDSMRRLPIDGVNVIEVDGRTILASTNGRFVFMDAVLYDTWNRKHLRTPGEIAAYVNKIDLDKLQLDRSLIGAIPVGSGDKPVTVFVDPKCPYCSQLLADAINSPELMKEYTFHVIIIPLLGEDSGRIARNLVCANAEGKLSNLETVQALASKDYSKVENYQAACNVESMQMAFVTAKLFGARGVPFIINADGRYANSMPPDLPRFLNEGIL